jgi:thymidylate synthase
MEENKVIEPDVRLGVGGLYVANKAESKASIDALIESMTECLQITIDSDETYKIYKECRKIINDEWTSIDNLRKNKIKDATSAFSTDMKEIMSNFDKAAKQLDEAIHKYETDNNIGSMKAKATKAANKTAIDAAVDALKLVIHCPNNEAKERIAQYAKDLGATIE